MQIIVEGLALAAFGTIRDSAQNPLPKRLLKMVSCLSQSWIEFASSLKNCCSLAQ